MAQTKNTYSKPKFIICFVAVVALMAGISHIFNLTPIDEEQLRAKAEQARQKETADLTTEDTVVDAGYTSETEVEGAEEIETPEEEEEADSDEEVADSVDMALPMPDTTDMASMYVSNKVWSYPICFPDSNSVQLAAARLNGVPPMQRRGELTQMVNQQRLSCISSSPYYVIDELTHSMPYLVPKAQMLLNTIGINFVDSLQSKGMALHLPIVTSVLRTSDDIRSLQHGNGNSVTNSCHCYGTTIDITYNRFMPLAGHTPTRYDDTLKKVLAEVLYDLRAQGRCYVKYERRQACFHLTVI